MRETQRHKDAFEYWLSLGGVTDNKTCELVASYMQAHIATFWRWYKEFNWRNRADIRLNARAKKIEEKTDNNVVDRKAKELAELDDIDKIAQAMIKSTVKKDEQGNTVLTIKISDDKGMASMIGAVDKIKKLKQLLIGEDTERSNVDKDALSDYIQKVLDREKGE